MRVTGGKYRGKNIEARTDRTLRPTTSRIRETMFNILKHGSFIHDNDFIRDDNLDLIADRNVIDIFCGTGALGIEALSRGAKHVFFVDQNSKTLSLARENISSLNELENASFIRSDSTMLPTASKTCNLVFIDPPYNRNLGIPAVISLQKNGWLAKGAIIVFEIGKIDDVTEIEGFKLLDNRLSDKTRLVFYQYTT